MPADPEIIQKIIRDPEFQALNKNPERQAQIVRDYLHDNEESFGGLPPDQQMKLAATALDHYQPGTLSKVLDVLPVIGPIKRAMEDPAQVRPFTRALMEETGYGGVLESGIGRGLAEAGREGLEWAALGKVVGPISRLLGAPAAEAVTGATGLAGRAATAAGAGAVDEAAALSAKAITRAVMSKYIDRAVTDGTIGALYGAVDAVERGEFHPFQQFIINPIAGAAFGLVLQGASQALDKYGPYLTREARTALQQDPELVRATRDLSEVTSAYAKTAKVPPTDAGEVILRGLREPLERGEFALLRQTITDNPNILKTDAGLRLLQTQREHMLPKVVEDVSPVFSDHMHVTIERPGGRIETIIDPVPSEMRRLAALQGSGDIHIMNAKGRGAEQFITQANTALEESGRTGWLARQTQEELQSGLGPMRQGTTPEPTTPMAGMLEDVAAQGRLPIPATSGTMQSEINQGLGPLRRQTLPTGPGAEGAVREDLSAMVPPRPANVQQTMQLPEGTQGSYTGAEQARGVQGNLFERLPAGTSEHLVVEQVRSAIPIELRDLPPEAVPVSVIPARQAIPITEAPPQHIRLRPDGTVEAVPPSRGVPVAIRGEQSEAGLPTVNQVLRDAASTNSPVTVATLRSRLGVQSDEARSILKQLKQEGRVSGKNKVTGFEAKPEPESPATPAPAVVGSLSKIPNSSEVGTVIEATPVAKVVKKADGSTVKVVPTADGGEAELVKEPGLPVAPKGETVPEKPRPGPKTLSIPEMTPEQRLAVYDRLNTAKPSAKDLETMEAIIAYDTDGKLSAAQTLIRCRP